MDHRHACETETTLKPSIASHAIQSREGLLIIRDVGSPYQCSAPTRWMRREREREEEQELQVNKQEGFRLW